MPFKYRIDVAQRLLETIYTGVLTIEDMRNSTEQAMHDTAFDASFRVLLIFDGANIAVSSADLIRYKQWREQGPKVSQMAIVAPTDAEFGVSRMYELATDSTAAHQLRVFRTLKDARAWLGLADS